VAIIAFLLQQDEQGKKGEKDVPISTKVSMIGRTLLLLTLLGTAWSVLPVGTASKSSAADPNAEVPALLADRCIRCHGPGKAEAGLRLDLRNSATSKLESGNVAVVPGDPDGSELLRRASDSEDPMPPEGAPLTVAELQQIRTWIGDGAIWKQLWAYRVLHEPIVPQTTDSELSACIKTPIDAFILHRLKQRGLEHSAPADRRTLLRRVYYDLIGLPPTPEEMTSFLNDKTPTAYQRVVDELLSRPQYGERWARHWMDVVHYADTHGFEHDIYRDSWPYRDYLIQSFNADKPYARFVQEQVAGDVMFPDDPQALIATGFLATGPWDLSALQSGNPESIDHLISQYLDRDDIVSTVMSTFVSSTVGCARCHDHKFDPVSQADYYNLQAIFAGIDKATRLVDVDAEVAKLRVELPAHKAELQAKLASEDASLFEEPLQSAAIGWLALLPSWTVLDPISFVSTEGATLVKQPDGSILSTGVRPEKDTYTVRVQTSLKRLTAVRIDLIADERLPLGGPGRQENGNLHLNELTLTATPLNDRSTTKDIALKSARADFNQAGWEAEKSIDNNPGSAWGIHPQVGKSHSAYYVLQKPLTCEAGFELTFTLTQTHGDRHIIGRFRLGAIAAEDPDSLVIDTHLQPIIDTAPESRTKQQQAELAVSYLNWPLDRELSALPQPQQLYCGTNRFTGVGGHQPATKPRPIHVLGRGDIRFPGVLAQPGAMSCVPGLHAKFEISDPMDEGARRVALACWLSDNHNVLTWRSIINRVWHYHFGRGLVATPSDFGRMGTPPTHPELIDWLALRFQENEGSLKWLHRTIVMSNVYQQSSYHHKEHASIDSENQYLWRMNRNVLDAESIRDSILQFSGKLNLTMGGPPVKQFVETKVFGLRKEADYAAFDIEDPGNFRRSIYRYVYRTMPDPFMNAMDCPDASQRAPIRNQSITALQAAAMMNDPLLVRQCEHMAERLAGLKSNLPDQIAAAFQLLYGRPPETQEVDEVMNHAVEHGLSNVCRVLLNSNEFLFVD
jgi:cytochrome c553